MESRMSARFGLVYLEEAVLAVLREEWSNTNNSLLTAEIATRAGIHRTDITAGILGHLEYVKAVIQNSERTGRQRRWSINPKSKWAGLE